MLPRERSRRCRGLRGVILIDRASSAEGNVDFRQRIEIGNPKEALDDVTLGLTVVVIASESTLARTEKEGLPARNHRGGRCIGREARGSRASRFPVLLRLGR